MKRFFGGLAAVLILSACTATPGGSPARTDSPAPGGETLAPIVSEAVGTAEEQLCDESNPAGLANLASSLDDVGASTDVTQVNTSLNQAMANLAQVDDASSQAARDAVASAAQAFQQALNDPNTRDQFATALAQTLREAETAICS